MKRKLAQPAPLLVCAAAAALIVLAGLFAAGVFPPHTGPPGPSQPVYAALEDGQAAGTSEDVSGEVGFVASEQSRDGAQLVKEKCGSCHQVRLLQKQRLSPQRWEALIKRMEKYDVELTDAERQTLIAYLTATN